MRADEAQSGFTLVELLVTMSIIVLLAGLSFAGLMAMTRSSALEREAADAMSAFIACSAAAERTRMPAFVVADPEQNSIICYGMELESGWHFETSDISALPLAYEGTVEIVPGFAGSAIQMGLAAEEGGGKPAGAAVFKPPYKRFAYGGFFECYVRLMAYGEQTLFRWGDAVEFQVTVAGRLEARAGGTTVRNPHVMMNLYRWVRVGCLFSEPCLAVFMDGAVIAEDEPQKYSPPADAEAEISSLRYSLRGQLDEARLASLRRLAEWQGSRFQLKLKDARIIWFAADGALDSDVHTAPVLLPFQNPQEPQTDFNIRIETNGEASRDAAN